jgi:hypothetical protein
MADRERPAFRFGSIRVFPGASDDAPSPHAPSGRKSDAAETPAHQAPAPAALAPRDAALDSCARLHWDRGQRLGSYRACGYAGFVAGLSLVLTLTTLTGTSHLVALIVVIAVPASFLAAVRASALVFGVERIVFFEKALLALGATALGILAIGGDVGAGLDLAALGIGSFLAFGRVGCFMVGCCHGRPARWGVRYGVEHARAGFAWYHVGRRIFPLQLVDGLVSLVLVVVGAAVLLGPHAHGAVAAGYLLAYGAVRFVEEPFRGDAARPCVLGLSEAQWTAVVLAVGIAALARRQVGAAAAIVVAAILVAAALALAVLRDRLARTAWGLTSPWHVDELHRLLLRLERTGEPSGGGVGVGETSHGLCVSLRRIEGPPALRDYVLSFADRPLPLRAALRLVEHVRFGRDPAEQVAVRGGATPGLVHVLVSAAPPGDTAVA